MINFIKRYALLTSLSVLFICQQCGAQVVTVNGAFVSTGASTVINIDTIRTDNTGSWANAGTLTLASLINAGTLQGSGTYNISRLFTNTGTFTANNSTVNLLGNVNQNFPGVTYYNLAVSGSSTIKTASGSAAVNGTLTIGNGVTLDMVTYPLSGTPVAVSGTGTFKTQNTSVAPIPAGKTWEGPVYYNSSSAQTIISGNYADLVASGGDRTIDSIGTIGIAGTFTTGSGTYTVTSSTVDFNGAGAQTIPAITYHHLKASGGNTKSLGGNIAMTGSLTMGASTTLALGSNNIRLKSDSTYTARVATFPATANITYGTGRFIAERYIKGRRKYRLMTSPVTTSPNATLVGGEEALSIWGNWQNQANNSTPNVGTFITGGNSGDGYDQQTTNASMFTYNSTTRLFEGFTTANGKNTKYTPLKAGVPYYMFVYGDRTNSAITSSPNKTTFSTTGKLLTGDQTYTTASTIPLSNTVGGYTMLGNPFASPIDWASVSRTNLSDTYWGWDPNLGSTGGYVTVSTTGTVTLISPFSGTVGLDQYIQSGQGFFVKTTAASPVLTIRETDKANNFNPIAFRTGVNSIPLLAVNLFYDDATGTTLADGALAAFDPSFSNQVAKEDASKIIKSSGEVLSLQVQPELLSINARRMPVDGDTLFVYTDRLVKPQYRLQIFARQLDSSTLEPYLEDTYLHTTRLLSLTDTNNVNFSVAASVPASAGVNRFRIVFRQSGGLSGIISGIQAVKENRTIKVNWDVSSETGVQQYELQRADAASSFTKLTEVTARGTAQPKTYAWTDNNPVPGINHYRVKVKMADGSSFFSRTVQVNMEEQKPLMKVLPNPVQNYEIKMKFIDMEKGKYIARLFDQKGQMILQQEIEYDGGPASPVVQIAQKIIPGVYYFQVTNQKMKLNQTLFIE